MDREPGKVRKCCSKRQSVGETCPVHSGVDPQKTRTGAMIAAFALRAPPASPCVACWHPRPPRQLQVRLFILGQLRTGHLSCGAQGLPSRKHIGELAPPREGWAGNWTLRAAQRSENLWKSDLALGVLSQGHESPSGTENRWHSANTSRRRRMRPSSWGGHKVELQCNPAPRARPPDAPEVAALLRASREPPASPSLPQVILLPPPTHLLPSSHDGPSRSCPIQP
ncbi:uncharacterized protein [Gorilla gorilla gorilla]|uniref:uncharacterized protein n=1 Tax=Gorilla gorilla gorilla TaxID=9595 RepID=UPI0024464208|nr:uncharacterized protein LOC129529993 [Gorilla gorilla gorilla]